MTLLKALLITNIVTDRACVDMPIFYGTTIFDKKILYCPTYYLCKTNKKMDIIFKSIKPSTPTQLFKLLAV